MIPRGTVIAPFNYTKQTISLEIEWVVFGEGRKKEVLEGVFLVLQSLTLKKNVEFSIE